MKAKFKLSQLALQDTITKELMHPKHGETGIEFTLAGPTHPTWKAAMAEYEQLPDEASMDEKVAANKLLLSKCVLSWNDDEAMEAPFSPEAAHEIMTRPGNDWMVGFVSKIVTDYKNFFL